MTTPHGSKPGASGMTPVCRPTPTVRFNHMSETCSKQLMYWLARLTKTVVFLPTALRRGTRRNAIRFETCNKNCVSILIQGARNVNGFPEVSGAAFIPLHQCRGLPPRVGKMIERVSTAKASLRVRTRHVHSSEQPASTDPR